MIRPAVADDLPGVELLDSELFGPDAWSAAALVGELAGPGRRFVVDVSEDHELRGYAVSMSLGDTVDLLRVGVRECDRRSGLATALVDELLADPGGADRALLEVSSANRAAVAFYARVGFSQIDVRPRYYRDGSDALVMRRSLGTGCGGSGRMTS